MKNKKLTIQVLTVKSFITISSTKEKATIQGGIGLSRIYNKANSGCGYMCYLEEPAEEPVMEPEYPNTYPISDVHTCQMQSFCCV